MTDLDRPISKEEKGFVGGLALSLLIVVFVETVTEFAQRENTSQFTVRTHRLLVCQFVIVAIVIVRHSPG